MVESARLVKSVNKAEIGVSEGEAEVGIVTLGRVGVAVGVFVLTVVLGECASDCDEGVKETGGKGYSAGIDFWPV